MDDLWKWVIGGGVGALLLAGAKAIKDLLSERAKSKRRDEKDLAGLRSEFEQGLQRTIDGLRSRLDTAEKDIRDCLEDRAALRAELEMLKKGKS